jgi:chromosome partitioning protein
MKIVAVWNPKGGVGKSVLAVNLAAAACELGIKTLVIDEDQQGMALAYGKAGNVPFTVVGKSPKNRPDADLVVIDHQASDWNIPKAPLLLMPTKPARGDYRTYATARAMAE